MISRVILAIKDDTLREKIKRAVLGPGIVVDTVVKRDLLWDRISRESGDLIIVSRAIIPAPNKVRLLRDLPGQPAIVVVFDHSDSEEQAAFVAVGCDATLTADLARQAIRKALAAILNKRARILDDAVTSNTLLGTEPRILDFVSSSPSMHAFMNVVKRIIPTDVSLLILGETGVGKERLARAIHAEGHRSEGPFIAVNCGALPEALLESELFGHEKGAFTGATRSRRGWFEMAHNGTIFLDEIAELQAHLQVKLLRVLQDHEIKRVGSEKSVKINIRIMAATNCDLAVEIQNGGFRKDLYYRLSVVTLTVPPLRERREDIPELIENYINYLSSRIGCVVTGIESDAVEALSDYDWPGNVRELINIIERAMILCESDRIVLADLPEDISGRHQTSFDITELKHEAQELPEEVLNQPLRKAKRTVLEGFEKSYLAGLLKATNGRVGKTAQRAGIQPRSLHEKMKYYGLRKEAFRHVESSA